jgi:Cytochrome oxidase complex assembly protein 1
MTPNAQAPMQQPSWFSRNWKWLLPVGCLVPMVCCGVFGIGTYFAATQMIKSSGAYVGALASVNDDAEVAAALGTPVTPGLAMSGSVKTENNRGSADFTVPVEGSKAKGSLHVVGASTGAGPWVYSTISITTADGKTIDVLRNSKPEAQPDVPEQEPQDDPD